MRSAAIVTLTLLALALEARADPVALLGAPWPEPNGAIQGVEVAWKSSSPYVPSAIGKGPQEDPPTEARGTLFLPRVANGRAPAVVLLHGASGVQATREHTYGRQFAEMGIAALAVDVFGARRDFASSFTGRLLNITESMFLADAYSALHLLAARPDVDPARIAVMGFSYGGMVSVFAAYRQIADSLAPKGPRFAAHIAYYAPCMARFEDKRTTGAPVLMLAGGDDTIADPERCAAIATDLTAGGSPVEAITYPGAAHQWDGGFPGRRTIGSSLADCDFRVGPDGSVKDRRTTLPMIDGLTRRITLGLCIGPAYPIARDDEVRARSNRDSGAFLARAFAR